MTGDKGGSGELAQFWTGRLAELERRESSLRERIESLESELSGLIDFKLGLELVQCRIDIAILCVSVSSEARRSEKSSALYERAQKSAVGAVEGYDRLKSAAAEASENLDQFEENQRVRGSLDALILAGGGALFDEEASQGPHSGIARIVAAAIAKYAPPDDRYESLFSRLRASSSILRRIFSGFLAGSATRPPYGVDEETPESTSRVVLPLSQAIEFYETEVMPLTVEDLDRNKEVRTLIRELRAISVRPRSRPIVLPNDFYTHGVTRFTSDGEPLIPVSLSARFTTGTNIDRAMELIQDEVVRKLAGSGLFPPLDLELDRLRSLASGRKGSKLFPRSALDTRLWYRRLRARFPQLRLLEDGNAVGKLLVEARTSRIRRLRDVVQNALSEPADTDNRDHPTLIN